MFVRPGFSLARAPSPSDSDVTAPLPLCIRAGPSASLPRSKGTIASPQDLVGQEEGVHLSLLPPMSSSRPAMGERTYSRMALVGTALMSVCITIAVMSTSR